VRNSITGSGVTRDLRITSQTKFSLQWCAYTETYPALSNISLSCARSFENTAVYT